jgi:selenocysteine-specific elongation factor
VKHLVIGTAGHIDHGKSALVEALTGVHPDRLDEEKRRGITIDLGFADLDLAPDGIVSLVDVPGHERFVRHMVAGASGLDAVLLVIAADEGVKPQTREHLAIGSLLGLRRGLVVLSKTDLVDPELRGVAALEVAEVLRGSFLERAPVLPVSARTGEGVPELREALREMLKSAEERFPGGVPRLPIDRSFVLRGFGTVVTGTLVSGKLREGDEVEILPGGRRGRVRGLQVHRRALAEVPAGRRVAVNLQGLSCEAAPRGATLTAPGALRTTRRVRASVRLLPHAPESLRKGGPVRFHHGTAELGGRLRVLDEAGDGMLDAEVVLRDEAVLLPGDRFVLRRSAPVDTVGGGVIVDAHPPRRTRRAAGETVAPAPAVPADRVLSRVARAEAAGAAPSDLAAELGLLEGELGAAMAPHEAEGRLVRAAGRVFAQEAVEAVAALTAGTLGEFHRAEPLRAGMPRELLRTKAARTMPTEAYREILSRMADQGRIRLLGDRVAAASHRVVLSPPDASTVARIDEAFRTAGLDPPSIESVVGEIGRDRGARLVELLVEEGRLVKIRDGRLFHAEALDALRRKVRDYARVSVTMDVATFKDLAGVSRKNAIPLLEQLDSERVTRRAGNVREILGQKTAR